MDARPIGVLDSGLGGLTAARDLFSEMPDESIIYFGDTGRVPYGTRSARIIEKYTRQDLAFLSSMNVKAVVVACGTISSSVLPSIADVSDIPLVGVVGPACRAAAAASKGGPIGVIATAASVASGAYPRGLDKLLPGVRVESLACPLFVPLVESGRFDRNDPLVRAVVADALAPMREKHVDTLILGCTHYPLLKDAIADFMGPDTALIDVGLEAARHAKKLLSDADSLTDSSSAPTHTFFVSDSPESFACWGGRILSRDISGLVHRVEIENY